MAYPASRDNRGSESGDNGPLLFEKEDLDTLTANLFKKADGDMERLRLHYHEVIEDPNLAEDEAEAEQPEAVNRLMPLACISKKCRVCRCSTPSRKFPLPSASSAA